MTSRIPDRQGETTSGGLRALIALCLGVTAMACALIFGPVPARAQDDGLTSSYITPFPEGDVYQLRVVGDSLASGLHSLISETMASDGRVQVNRKRWTLNSLTRADYREEIRDLRRDLEAEKTHIAVIMVGAWDTQSVRLPNGNRVSVGSDAWRQEYTRRVDELIKSLKSIKVAIYWVGLPTMRRSNSNDAVQVMNEAVRERAYLSGVRYIDSYASFTGEDGGYSDYGPDLSGKVRLLRDRDGIHLSYAGYQKLAHFVEREVKRDLTQAKSERSIPLAGSEAEQARINPEKNAAAGEEQLVGWRASIAAAKQKAAASGENQQTVPGGFFNHSGGREQQSDNGRINLKTIDPSGREQIIALDIVRPAIPASVVALVTRKQSPDRLNAMGDTLVDQIAGGLNIMSSVTPPNEALGGNLRKLSPAQTPFFRVLVKGERLQSQPGRADDFVWPRPKPPPLPRAVKSTPAESNDGGIPLPGISPFRPRV